jgi:hypothetical protein
MEIMDLKQLFLLFLNPGECFLISTGRTCPVVTGVVRIHHGPTAVALMLMSSHNFSTAGDNITNSSEMRMKYLIFKAIDIVCGMAQKKCGKLSHNTLYVLFWS